MRRIIDSAKCHLYIAFLLLIFLTCSLFAIDVMAEENGTCGENATWTLDDQGILTITGTGEIEKGEWFYRDVKSIVISDGVEIIGDWTFSELPFCTEVFMPDSVVTIGWGAFQNCPMLSSIRWPQNLVDIQGYAFCICDSLTAITIPAGVQTIGECAFSSSDSLQSVFIPKSVYDLHPYTFLGCNVLLSIDVDADNPSYSSVEGVLFNKNQTTIICCPSGKTGQYIIPDSVVSVGDSAFFFSSLSSVSVPGSVASIGPSAFGYGKTLEKITVAQSNANYSSQSGVLFNKDKKTLICYPGGNIQESYAIPEGVTKIEEGAFASASDVFSLLSTILIPSSVKEIGDGAFSGCYTDTVYYVGSEDEWWRIKWGAEAEKGLFGIQYLNGAIILPEDTETIEEEAFSDVHNVEIVISSKVSSISETTFNQDVVIVCPVGSYAATRCSEIGLVVLCY